MLVKCLEEGEEKTYASPFKENLVFETAGGVKSERQRKAKQK
jgi:hypothetical protein